MNESYGLVPGSPDKANLLLFVGMYNLLQRNASLVNSMLEPSFSGGFVCSFAKYYLKIIR